MWLSKAGVSQSHEVSLVLWDLSLFPGFWQLILVSYRWGEQPQHFWDISHSSKLDQGFFQSGIISPDDLLQCKKSVLKIWLYWTLIVYSHTHRANSIQHWSLVIGWWGVTFNVAAWAFIERFSILGLHSTYSQHKQASMAYRNSSFSCGSWKAQKTTYLNDFSTLENDEGWHGFHIKHHGQFLQSRELQCMFWDLR